MVKNVYKHNIKYIKNLNLDLFRKIETTSINNVYIDYSKDKNKNIIKNTYDGNVHIHSSYDIKAEAKYISDFALKNKPDIVFVFGLGLGYELQAMKNQNSDIRYFVVEPDSEIFKFTMQTRDMKFLFEDSNLYFIQDDQYDNIINFFQKVIVDDKNINIKLITMPSYESLYRQLINKIYEYIKIVMNVFKVNMATNLFNHRQWFQNGICNLKYLKKTAPINILKDSFKNMPAVIVSAGPSLNENIEAIKKIKGKAIIAAVGSGIAVMEKNNISSDITSAVDGSKLEEQLLENIDINAKSAFFYNSILYYTVASKMGDSKFLMNISFFDEYYGKLLNWDQFDIYSGPSVANTMAYNLSQLGCNPIIFLGQDLCYSMGKSYADGIEDIKGENKIDNDAKKGSVIMRNKIGEAVYTNSGFMAMKDLMENCIASFPNTTYLNGTRMGLKIDGARDIDFNQYAEKYLVPNINHNIKTIVENTYRKYLKNMDFNFVDEKIRYIKRQNDKITDICREILNYTIDNDVQTSDDFLENKKLELSKISFYKEVILKYLNQIDYIFKRLDYKNKNLKTYSYILDKCLIINNAFMYEIYGGTVDE